MYQEIQTMAYGCKMNRRDVGKVHHMLIPGVKNLRYRWVTRMRDDGRFYGRTPKVGVLLRDLKLLRNADFGAEHLLPEGVESNSKGGVLRVKRSPKRSPRRSPKRRN